MNYTALLLFSKLLLFRTQTCPRRSYILRNNARAAAANFFFDAFRPTFFFFISRPSHSTNLQLKLRLSVTLPVLFFWPYLARITYVIEFSRCLVLAFGYANYFALSKVRASFISIYAAAAYLRSRTSRRVFSRTAERN